MDRNSLRALITGVLLVPLAWIVIALALKQQVQPSGLQGVMIWGALFVTDLVIAIYSVLHVHRVRAHGQH